MKLLIFYLTDDKRHFAFPHFIEMIQTSTKKKLWKLLILTHSNDNEFYINEMKKYDIDYETFTIFHENNYLRKVKCAINYAFSNNYPYLMKCDNDIFIKSETLDCMIDNLNLLDNSKHLTIGPVLTTGIPGVEYFKEQFLDHESQQTLNSLFLKTTFYDNYSGGNYEFLNKNTIQSSVWNKHDFFNHVKSMNHFYKGIHPIRVNEESLHFLNNYIIKNKKRFLSSSNMEVICNDDSAYLCNSIFCIKTDTYKNIVMNHNLYVDDFDEVPLNKYGWNHNMNHLFIKNGFAIHMCYNWKRNHHLYEEQFCKDFFKT